MSAKSLARTMISPSRARKNPSSPKSILKRPPPLSLSQSPFPFAGIITISVSPSPNSPHVHFPPSASLTSTFSVHSPNTYDRAAIDVSPNPLEIPAWGSRVYSPTSGEFTATQDIFSPKVSTPMISITFEENIITVPPETTPKTRAGARFAAKVNSQLSTSTRSREELVKAISQFPRSPYPSAPTSPSPMSPVNKENLADQRARPHRRSNSVDVMKPYKRPQSLRISGSRPFGEPRVRSPLTQAFRIDAVGENTLAVPSPLNLAAAADAAEGPGTRLSEAFWHSVSLSDEPAAAYATSLSPVPDSYEGSTPVSAVPPFVFGTKDGALWSPGLPRTSDRMDEAADVDMIAGEAELAELSIASPTKRTSFGVKRGSIGMSPSPNDPFAAFPSFSAVLSLGGVDGTITYPPRALLLEPSTQATSGAAVAR